MSSFLQLQELCMALSETMKPFDSAALINSDGQILGMKYESLPDIGTFGPLVETVRKYFPLKEGEAVLTNDPYNGGILLNVMNLVTAIKVDDQTFYLAVRTRFKPHLAVATKLDDEGLRIPPTPVAVDYKLNETILSAMSAHPLAPAGLGQRVTQKLSEVWRQTELLKKWCQSNPSLLSKNNQKVLLEETHSRVQRKLADLPHGDHRMDLQFDTGEVIRLHTEVKTDEIHFDFAGTSNSKRLFLTDLTTFGTCMGAFLSFLGEDFLLNQGVFSFLNVTTPQGCFLNAKYPCPTFEGIAEASTLLATAVVQSLSSIASSRAMGLNGTVPTILSYEFSNQKVFFDALPGGTGATDQGNGIDGYFFWNLRKLQTSVEEIERLYPLLILQCGIRQCSGGKGKSSGGNGVLREIEAQEDCTLKWLLGHKSTHIKGVKNISSGQPAEITIRKANGEEISLTEAHGQISLKKGDRVIAASAGGGGLGKVSETKSKD